MKLNKLFFLMPLLAVVIFVIGCGIGFEEKSFKFKLEDLDKLYEKADVQIKPEIQAKKQYLMEAYQGLPPQEGRKEKLSALNSEAYKFIRDTKNKIEEAGKQRQTMEKLAAKAELAGALPQYVGVWKGVGMDMTITEDGTMEYKRLKQGVTKSFSGGKVVSISGDQMKVKVFVSDTSFVVNVPPHEDSGKWKMTLDGVELTRVVPE